MQKFKIFAGPKKPELLAAYNLEDLVYYGWFGLVAKPMLRDPALLLSPLVHNYGIAIIMLTVLVRSAHVSAQPPAGLNAAEDAGAAAGDQAHPEKYKDNVEARTKAQQELFSKHNYNPLAGCLPVFVQLPIFVGLYRSLWSTSSCVRRR